LFAVAGLQRRLLNQDHVHQDSLLGDPTLSKSTIVLTTREISDIEECRALLRLAGLIFIQEGDPVAQSPLLVSWQIPS
jgi:hypothetical protein